MGAVEKRALFCFAQMAVALHRRFAIARLPKFDRRSFLKISAGFIVGGLLPSPAWPLPLPGKIPGDREKRRLSFYNTHTDEMLDVCYCEKGTYKPEALAHINHILRDHRTGDITPIDVHLLDTLYAVRRQLGTTRAFHIISGYRSPATNAMLQLTTTGVVKNSFHTVGKAIDIRLPKYSTRRLRDLCVRMRRGGVGYYPESDFIHLDTGTIRAW